ncbi:hypothetical protein ACIOEX_33740, partial [Streptomyces sp. NPDC087850]
PRSPPPGTPPPSARGTTRPPPPATPGAGPPRRTPPGAARLTAGLLAAPAVLALAVAASVMFGSRNTSFGDVVDVLSGTADPYVTTV